jgi:hypothetical protein
VLLRKRNRGDITPGAFLIATSSLRNDVLLSPGFSLVAVDDAAILAGLPLMERYHVNATDAAILATLLDHISAGPHADGIPVVVATDQRLLRAAEAEGLRTLDPEVTAAEDVPALIASL